MSKVIVTMPAYHAEGTLARTVGDIPAGIADEIILVDDASTDQTVRVAQDIGGMTIYVHRQNRGYGGNQKTCYQRALEHGADVVVLLHPDYQYDPKAVPLLIAPILSGHADLTFGSRFAGQSDPRRGGMPMYRYLGNRITTTLENLMLGTRFSEMHSGLRAYSREALLSVPLLGYTDDFAFDSQMMVDAITSGLRVVEVPIPTRYTEESSSISIVRSLRYVGSTLSYAATKALARGRQGRRYPVTFRGRGTGRRLKRVGRTIRHACALCGEDDAILIYPSNVTDDPTPQEFSCTSDALARHDDIVQCRHCGLVSSIPTVDKSKIIANYEQMTDEEYLTEQEGRRELFHWVLDRMESYLLPGDRLVEVGSNVGLFLKVAGERGWDAHGYEPSRWAVATGRDRFDVDLRQGTVDDIETDEPVPTVLMMDVLEHLVDPVEDLTKLHKVMHPEGLLALSTINLNSIHGRLRKEEWPWFIRPHLHYFMPETLDATLDRAGFRLVEWSLVPRSFHLSYVAHRLSSSMGTLGRWGERLAEVADPKLPVGWLGDVVFVVARPQR